MNWRHSTIADWHQLSDCGRYSVCRIGGPVTFYEAWRTRQHEDGPHLIATNLATSAEARQIAEGDDRE